MSFAKAKFSGKMNPTPFRVWRPKQWPPEFDLFSEPAVLPQALPYESAKLMPLETPSFSIAPKLQLTPSALPCPLFATNLLVLILLFSTSGASEQSMFVTMPKPSPRKLTGKLQSRRACRS